MFCLKSWNLLLFKTLERYKICGFFVFVGVFFVVKLSSICGPYWEKAHIIDFKIDTVERVVLEVLCCHSACWVKC